MTIRMFAAMSGAITGFIGAGAGSPVLRAYTAAAGTPVDVPGDLSGDAAALANQGFFAIGTSGPTSARPTANLKPGALHVDTTLGAVVMWDGVQYWRSPVTGAVS